MWWPTRRAAGVLVIGTFFDLFAALFSLSIGFFISGVLFAMLLWNGLMSWNLLGGIRCQRRLQEEQMEGDTARVVLSFSHPSSQREIEDLLIKDHFPSAWQEPDVFLYAPKISLTSPAEFSYTKPCQKRGVYQLGPVVFKTGDPYGFFTHKKVLHPKGRMVVYPRLFDLSDFPILPTGSTAQMGLSTGNRQGDSGDYFASREYQQGDTLRIVHWRATAQRGELIVKQFEKLASSEVTLLLDLHPEANIGKGSESSLEVGIRVIGSIAKYLMLNEILVQFIAHGEQPILRPLGKGHEHLANCLEILSEVSSNGKLTLAELIGEYEDQIEPDTTVVVPLLDTDMEGIEAIAALKKKAVDIVALVIVTEAFKINDPHYRLDQFKFADLYANLGAHVYPIRPYSYEELARQFNSLEGFVPRF